MRRVAMLAPALLAAALLIGLPEGADAQVLPGTNPQRDCKTLVACRFTAGGSYRGCISAYSCRVCKLVSARCQVKGGERRCQEMRCGWG